MCDYCDCRSRAPLAELSAEHEQILALLYELETAVAAEDVDRARSTRENLASKLERHSRTEERGLYPELAAGGVDVTALVNEHRVVDAALHHAGLEAATQAIAALRAHIRDEEHDLFPAAHQLLGDAAWARLEASSPEMPAGR
jgi:hemerythrin-like domain-containing protein